MTIEQQNKAICRRIPLEMFNKGNLAVADEVFATDYVEHAVIPGFPTPLDGLKQFVMALRTVFPDVKYTIEEELAEGDKVVQLLRAHGTQRGALLGLPASGRQATWIEIHIARMTDGKLVEHWASVDQLGMLHQLGISALPSRQSADAMQDLSDAELEAVTGGSGSSSNFVINQPAGGPPGVVNIFLSTTYNQGASG